MANLSVWLGCEVARAATLRQALAVQIAPELRETLAAAAAAMAAARHDWWVISSAAVALHGGDPGTVRDVDVLIDLRDADPLFAALGLPQKPGEGDALFRSERFGTWHGAVLPVELFAGFTVHESGQWNPVRPLTRQAITVDGATLYVPEKVELKAMLLRFGRPKDLTRAASL